MPHLKVFFRKWLFSFCQKWLSQVYTSGPLKTERKAVVTTTTKQSLKHLYNKLFVL